MKKLLPVVIVLVISIFAVRPLFVSGYFSMHDDQQVVRLHQMDKALMGGQFPVRWVSDLGFGYGYPLFNFYPPFVYYLGEAFHLMGFGFIDSIKIVWGVALIGSALSMYLLLKEFFGKLGGIVSAIFYLYAPYHAVDAFVRGALAELFSFVWLPLILLSVYKRRTVLTGVLLALLMITHNLIFMPFMGFFAIWALIYDRRSLFISPVIAFGLTAFFWLPALWEKQYTLVDQLLIKNLASYKIHFVCLSQFWNSPWGFGGSTAGCIDGMSFMIGRIYIFLSLVGLFVGIFKKSGVLVLGFVLFLFAGFMATSYSRFIWEKIPQLWYLQFPWRFMEFMVLFSSLAIGGVAVLLKNKIINLFIVVILLYLLIVTNSKYFTPREYYFKATDKSLTSEENIKWNISSTSFEFMPKGVVTHINNLGVVWVDINESQISKGDLKLISGDLVIGEQNFNPGNFTISGISSNGAILQIQQSNFPGWKIWIDRVEAKIYDNNKYKLITISVPPGEHVVSGKFTNTVGRLIGNLISLLSILFLVCIWILKKLKVKR